MAQDYNHRIGARYLHIGGGAAPTVSDIEDLTERRRQEDKAAQKKPERPFSAYLEERQSGGGQPDDDRDPSQNSSEESAEEISEVDAAAGKAPRAQAPQANRPHKGQREQVFVPRGRHIIKG